MRRRTCCTVDASSVRPSMRIVPSSGRTKPGYRSKKGAFTVPRRAVKHRFLAPGDATREVLHQGLVVINKGEIVKFDHFARFPDSRFEFEVSASGRASGRKSVATAHRSAVSESSGSRRGKMSISAGNAAQFGCIEGRHALRGEDTEVIFAVGDEDRRGPHWSTNLWGGRGKRALSRSVRPCPRVRRPYPSWQTTSLRSRHIAARGCRYRRGR